jgi:hypothetical protein
MNCSLVFGLVEENKQRQKLRRLNGLSGLGDVEVSGSFGCAQDDDFGGGVGEEQATAKATARTGEVNVPNHRPIRRAQDGAPGRFGWVEQGQQQGQEQRQRQKRLLAF